MIKNQRQYKVTEGQIATLHRALAVAAGDRLQMADRVYAAMAAGIRSHIAELESQLREYDALKAL